MSAARRTLLSLLSLLSTLSGCKEEPTPTHVLLILEADPVIREQARSVRVSAYATAASTAPPRDEGALTDRRDWEVSGDASWPIRVLLTPQRFAEGRYRIVASTELDGFGRVETQVISGYVAGEVRVVRLRLYDACLGAGPCEAEERCDVVGECEDAVVAPEALECLDSGCRPDGGRDAGDDADAAPDAAPSADAGGRDAGPIDAGADAGPPPPPASPSRFDFPSVDSIEVLGGASLGDGVLVVGSAMVGTNRDAFALHYLGDGGSRWASRFGEATRNERFYAAAARGTEVVAAGLHRGGRGTGPNNDLLLVRVGPTGLGMARTYGTTEDELLYGLTPGGAVAHWIGFGECGVRPNREALVVAFDSALQVEWASCARAGAGEDAFFSSGIVVGNTIFAVGAIEGTGSRTFVARIGAPDTATMPFGWRSADTGSRAVAATWDPVTSRVLVAGSLMGLPALLRFDEGGSFHGATWVPLDSGAALTNVRVDGVEGVPFVTGVTASDAIFLPWVAALRETITLQRFDDASVTAFLPTPIVEAGGARRVVVQSGGRAVLDLPFNRAPEAGCGVPATSSPDEATDGGEAVPLTLTPRALAATVFDAATTTALVPGTSDRCAP